MMKSEELTDLDLWDLAKYPEFTDLVQGLETLKRVDPVQLAINKKKCKSKKFTW